MVRPLYDEPALTVGLATAVVIAATAVVGHYPAGTVAAAVPLLQAWATRRRVVPKDKRYQGSSTELIRAVGTAIANGRRDGR